MKATVDILLGAQWGDEGKGKVVDLIAPGYEVVARFQGGPNAGHTLMFEGQKHVLHTIPSGVFREGVMNLVGNGVVIDPVTFMKEVQELEKTGVDLKEKLVISRRAHLILPTHRALDAASEADKGKQKIGSTLKGIGPAYMDKTGRNGLRVGDMERPDFKERYQSLAAKHERLFAMHQHKVEWKQDEAAWLEAVQQMRVFKLVDGAQWINDRLQQGNSVLAEGAQGTLLDIDFGTYPFVTSSNTISAGACSGLGIGPRQVGRVIGVFKAYTTRVGSGPFPTELHDQVGKAIAKAGKEFGATTGRARRCGWLDLPALRYAVMVNGITQLAMMKADVLCGMDHVNVCVAYRMKNGTRDTMPYDLADVVEPVYEQFKGWGPLEVDQEVPQQLEAYIGFVEQAVGVPITVVSIGPDRSATIQRQAAPVGR